MKRYLALWMIAVACVAHAQVPMQINYQGRLTTDTGQPLSGTFSAEFRIVRGGTATDAGTGLAVFTNPTSISTDANGVFSYRLGTDPSYPLSPSVFTEGDDLRFIEVRIDPGTGEEVLLPRQLVASVPYAVKAAVATPPGSIIMFGGTNTPSGWLLCDGSTLSRALYPDLFAAIGTTWGVGDGSTTFNLPDLRGRSPMGVNNESLPNGKNVERADRNLNDQPGAETCTLTTTQMPSHDHSGASGIQSQGHTHSVDPPNRASTTQSQGHTHSVNPPNTGTSNQDRNHTHTVDPPSTGTSGGNHDHLVRFKGGANDGSSYPSEIEGGHGGGGDWISNETEGDGAHSHSVNIGSFSSGGINGSHGHSVDIPSFTSGGQSDSHTHDVNIPAFASAAQSASHTHSISAEGGGTAHDILQPSLAVNFIIKH